MRGTALYRLPHESEVRSEHEIIVAPRFEDLHQRRGFVVVPFTNYHKETAPTPYAEQFARFMSELESGRLSKVVLSRSESIGMRATAEAAFEEACNTFPNIFVYLLSSEQTGLWLGATPELLRSGKGEEWRTVALAGTSSEADRQEWDAKNLREQAFVAYYMRERIARHGQSVAEEGPQTGSAGTVSHLRTDFRFRMPRTEMGLLLSELHPSPAVCGVPKDEALRFIEEHAAHDRKLSAGFLGPTDPHGSTHLFVNLRCAHITDDRATLYAGSGLLGGSTLAQEWEETCHKMNAMRYVLR